MALPLFEQVYISRINSAHFSHSHLRFLRKMFAPKFDVNKLKTNLRICVVRMKNLYSKKNELNVRARRELAEYLRNKKIDRARIRVEQIVREDYLLEVLEIIELYCELLITRMGLITSTVECDPGLREAVATLIWCAPRLSYDCQELNVLKDQFMVKYGKEFCQACLSNANHDVNPKVMQKLNVKAPPANLCEAYLVEIAKSYDVEFTPDTNLLCNQPKLVDLGEPPELPNYNFFDDGFLNPTPMGPGAPYPPPLNPEDDYNKGIPSLPPQSGPNYNDMPNPGAPPPYQKVGSPSDKEANISGLSNNDEGGSCKKNDNEKKGEPPAEPPTNDDDDFDALAARFNSLRRDN
ncbi:unnamed protein product [Hymenolepis diminuta]|uniref:IST1 homolog n=1 Tax=Hymenolepis diminuta TaxID=6216 RepID=A0A3P6ZZU0_HYMDI|nr:unnamed protein product [Hymenolepis diminuta]